MAAGDGSRTYALTATFVGCLGFVEDTGRAALGLP